MTPPAHDHPAIHGRRFSETLRIVRLRAAAGPISLAELFEIGGPQGHGFLAIFLVLPFLQPIPLPGISSVIGLLLAVIGVFVAVERPPWLPSRVAHRTVEPEAVLRICSTLEGWMARVEHVIRPRAQWLFAHRWFRVLNCTIWVAHAVVFSLPLPIPLSNAFPATVILLMALGTVEEDVGVIGLAYLGAVANLAFFASLFVLPQLGWRAINS